MINFRFHLVSLVAVFLALGLGILVGSTVIDQGIVNRLDSEINSVRKENSAREATSKQLSQQNSDLQQFIARSAPFVGDGRLESLSIAVVAEQGLDRGIVKQTTQALQAAGAEVPGVVWLDDPWRLDTDSRVQSLQAALGLTGTASSMRDTALDLLVRRLAKAPTTKAPTTTEPTSSANPRPTTSSTGEESAPTTATTPTAPPIDALNALDKAGFVSITDGNVSDFAAFPSHPVNVLVISGDDSDFAGGDFTATFVRAVVGANLPTVVGAVYDAGSNPTEAPQRGASLASILDDRALSRSASTVDDLDLVPGQVAAVLSLEVIGSGNVGHYGYGTGATAPLPPHHS